MSQNKYGRRRFFKDGAALAGLAIGAVQSARGAILEPDTPKARHTDLWAYGDRSRFDTSVRNGRMGLYDVPPAGESRDFGLRTPLQDSVGIITPNSLHYVISHGYEPPDINPKRHRLLIHGMVERPLIFTMPELMRLPSTSRTYFLECNANGAPSGPAASVRNARTATVQGTHGYTSCSEWTGVPLSVLLEMVGVQAGASWVVAEGSESGKHTKSIPLEKAMDDTLVAYGQNGEALRPQQGYPLRLLVPGWEGINNVKWLRRIKVVDKPYMGMWESTKYPQLHPDGKARWFQFEMGPRSVITRPSGGQRLSGPGFYGITGLAWSGGGAIRRVEVSTDGGQTWQGAELQGPVHPKAHTRFGFAWNWKGEECVLQSRCTDDRDEVQPTKDELAKFWGATPDFFQKTSFIVGHFNAIQPWHVNRDGSIYNAIF